MGAETNKNHHLECEVCQKYFKITTVASMLEVSDKTIRRMISTGQLKIIRFGGCIRIPHSEISKAIRNYDWR